MFTLPLISHGFSSVHSSSFSSPPISPPAFHHSSSLSHLLHYKDQKKLLTFFCPICLQGIDQVLPFLPFYQKAFKHFLPTYSHFLILFSLCVLTQNTSVLLSGFISDLLPVLFLLSFFASGYLLLEPLNPEGSWPH